jgi:hypothetical protein
MQVQVPNSDHLLWWRRFISGGGPDAGDTAVSAQQPRDISPTTTWPDTVRNHGCTLIDDFHMLLSCLLVEVWPLDSEEHTATLTGTAWLGRQSNGRYACGQISAHCTGRRPVQRRRERQVRHPTGKNRLCGRLRPQPHTLYTVALGVRLRRVYQKVNPCRTLRRWSTGHSRGCFTRGVTTHLHTVSHRGPVSNEGI